MMSINNKKAESGASGPAAADLNKEDVERSKLLKEIGRHITVVDEYRKMELTELREVLKWWENFERTGISF